MHHGPIPQPRASNPQGDIAAAHVGESVRLALLTIHGVGIALTGVMFAVDAHRGAFRSGAYGHLADLSPALPWVWAVLPMVAGVLMVAGIAAHLRPLMVAGLSLAGCWYAAQTVLFAANAAGHWSQAMIGPLGVYALLLAPKVATHLAGIAAVEQARHRRSDVS